VALISGGALTATAGRQNRLRVARTNAYEVPQIGRIRLAIKDERPRLLDFPFQQSTALEKPVEDRRKGGAGQEGRLHAGVMPSCLNSLLPSYSEQPGCAFFRDPRGPPRFYEDHLQNTRQRYILCVRPMDEKNFGDALYKYMKRG